MKQWFVAFRPMLFSWRRIQTSRSFQQEQFSPSLVEEAAFREFPEHRVKIETCGEVYRQWRIKNKFRVIPKGNLTFDIKYVDTQDEKKLGKNAPVVLALHGAPGTYKDFGLLTSYLFDQGMRVIAPNFPDFSSYPPGVFRFSLDEKTQLVKDFLDAINVPQVDMLICHSSAVYPGLQLCVDNKPYISSLALFNPGGFSTEHSAILPYPLLQVIVFLSETKLGLEMLKYIGPPLLARTTLRVENLFDPLLSATTMVHGNIQKARKNLYHLSKRQFPVFLAFSEDDKMIRKELSYRIAYKLGSQDLDITYVAEDGTILKEGRIVNNVKTMAFEKGTHYAFRKHSDIINPEIYSFLASYVL